VQLVVERKQLNVFLKISGPGNCPVAYHLRLRAYTYKKKCIKLFKKLVNLANPRKINLSEVENRD